MPLTLGDGCTSVELPEVPAISVQPIEDTPAVDLPAPSALSVETISRTVEVENLGRDPRSVAVLRGLPGPTGPTGPAGGGSSEYVHHQVVAASTWTVLHDLSTKPDLVLILDEDPGVRVYTDVNYPDDSTAVVEWPTPVTGYAYAR